MTGQRWIPLFRSAGLSIALLLGASAVSCDSEPQDDAPDDPAEYYGPCDDNPHCGMGSQLGSQSSGGWCLCTVFCEEDSDCPIPDSGTTAPICFEDDVVINGMSGECALPCSDTMTCPDAFECFNGRCGYPG